jgi:hypothetical protein
MACAAAATQAELASAHASLQHPFAGEVGSDAARAHMTRQDTAHNDALTPPVLPPPPPPPPVGSPQLALPSAAVAPAAVTVAVTWDKEAVSAHTALLAAGYTGDVEALQLLLGRMGAHEGGVAARLVVLEEATVAAGQVRTSFGDHHASTAHACAVSLEDILEAHRRRWVVSSPVWVPGDAASPPRLAAPGSPFSRLAAPPRSRAQERRERTALQAAASHGQLPAVAALLAAGASPATKNREVRPVEPHTDSAWACEGACSLPALAARTALRVLSTRG